MSELIYTVKDIFECKDCGLMYHEGDKITVRHVNGMPIHDCDNCLRAIELAIKEDKASIR